MQHDLVSRRQLLQQPVAGPAWDRLGGRALVGVAFA